MADDDGRKLRKDSAIHYDEILEDAVKAQSREGLSSS